MQNIDVGRAWAKNYYGAPSAVTGSGATATWDAPLNQTSNYANEARDVASKGEHWLKANRKVANRAIVLDVDDTTLTTWNYELYSNWDFNPTTNAQFVGLTGSSFTGNAFPATPGMIDLVNQAKGYGYAIFFLTGRGDSQHQATIANLINDTAAGFPADVTVTISGKTIPEVDANYQTPTPLNSGHGPAELRRRPLHQAGDRLVPGVPEPAPVLRAEHHGRSVLPDDPVQVGHARVHRVAGLRHRRQLRRPVQRSAGRLRRQDVQDAEPELLPPVGEE